MDVRPGICTGIQGSLFKQATGDISGCGERGQSQAVKYSSSLFIYKLIATVKYNICSTAVMSTVPAVLFEIENPVQV